MNEKIYLLVHVARQSASGDQTAAALFPNIFLIPSKFFLFSRKILNFLGKSLIFLENIRFSWKLLDFLEKYEIFSENRVYLQEKHFPDVVEMKLSITEMF